MAGCGGSKPHADAHHDGTDGRSYVQAYRHSSVSESTELSREHSNNHSSSFFHEMMHATAVHGIDPSDPNFPKDFGYGFDKITSLAQSNAVQSFTNADTLTYWCK